jgi:N-acetylmuramoyl-L-alanine amidase
MRIVISSGHALKVRGASGILDEVDEARKIVEAVAKNLRGFGHDVVTFHDDVSTSQNENLNRICNFHNAQDRALDCSVHLNAYIPTDAGMGTEVLYLTQEDIARRVVDAISNASGLINRGPKKRTDLYFLNNTDEPAILIETCFVDSKTDADLYRKYFDQICMAIARVGNQGRPQQYDWKGLASVHRKGWLSSMSMTTRRIYFWTNSRPIRAGLRDGSIRMVIILRCVGITN